MDLKQLQQEGREDMKQMLETDVYSSSLIWVDDFAEKAYNAGRIAGIEESKRRVDSMFHVGNAEYDPSDRNALLHEAMDMLELLLDKEQNHG